MRRYKLSCLFIIGLSCFFLRAQNSNKTQQIDQLITEIESSGRGMGSISLFQNGKEVYQRAYGYADVENQQRADHDTKYRIGSITKTFTATIIMKLVEEGKLILDTKLSDFYPQILNANDISISNLLRHRSGIFNVTSVSDYLEWNTKPIGKNEMIDKIIAGGSRFNPGDRMEYSNSNYILLTFIAEDVSGKSFEELLQQYIVKPCGLKNTYVGTSVDPSKNEAYSYTRLENWRKESDTDMSIPLGAGAIVSTPTDLNIFLTALFQGKIVSESSLQEMIRTENNVGAGLFQIPFHDIKGYGHNGGIDGFHSMAYYFPDPKLSLAIIGNGVVYPLNDIVIGVLSIWNEEEYKFPVLSPLIFLSPETLDKYTGVYSSPAFPLKITITREGTSLKGQATGQPGFVMEYIGNDSFAFDAVKLKMTFYPDENKMKFEQAGMVVELHKE